MADYGGPAGPAAWGLATPHLDLPALTQLFSCRRTGVRGLNHTGIKAAHRAHGPAAPERAGGSDNCPLMNTSPGCIQDSQDSSFWMNKPPHRRGGGRQMTQAEVSESWCPLLLDSKLTPPSDRWTRLT